jgi:hypothetical protein
MVSSASMTLPGGDLGDGGAEPDLDAAVAQHGWKGVSSEGDRSMSVMCARARVDLGKEAGRAVLHRSAGVSAGFHGGRAAAS